MTNLFDQKCLVVPCPHCKVDPQKLCVNALGNTMKITHIVRHEAYAKSKVKRKPGQHLNR